MNQDFISKNLLGKINSKSDVYSSSLLAFISRIYYKLELDNKTSGYYNEYWDLSIYKQPAFQYDHLVFKEVQECPISSYQYAIILKNGLVDDIFFTKDFIEYLRRNGVNKQTSKRYDIELLD